MKNHTYAVTFRDDGEVLITRTGCAKHAKILAQARRIQDGKTIAVRSIISIKD